MNGEQQKGTLSLKGNTERRPIVFTPANSKKHSTKNPTRPSKLSAHERDLLEYQRSGTRVTLVFLNHKERTVKIVGSDKYTIKTESDITYTDPATPDRKVAETFFKHSLLSFKVTI